MKLVTIKTVLLIFLILNSVLINSAAPPKAATPKAAPIVAEKEVNVDELTDDQKIMANSEEDFTHIGCTTSFINWKKQGSSGSLNEDDAKMNYKEHCEVLNHINPNNKYEIMTNACVSAYIQSLPGPFCWRRLKQIKPKGCPTEYTSCGPLACSSDGKNCAYSILKMILNTGLAVANLSTAIMSGGASMGLLNLLKNYGENLIQNLFQNMTIGAMINFIGLKLSQESPTMSSERRKKVIEQASGTNNNLNYSLCSIE